MSTIINIEMKTFNYIKHQLAQMRSLSFLQKLKFLLEQIKKVLQTASFIFQKAKLGELSWLILIKLASRNLRNASSRSAITIGAMASGTASIVFLVGFAYGLQSIVTQRLIQPNSLRLADVQTSSTALELNTDTLKTISSLSGVADVAGAMSSAGSLSVNGSRSEVVVVGVRNEFLEYSHIEMIAGEKFSPEAQALPNHHNTQIEELVKLRQLQPQVAGATTTQDPIFENGQPISDRTVRFRIDSNEYLPLRSSPDTNSEIVGYVKGGVLTVYSGIEVWGSTYSSVGVVGRAHQNSTGEWKGKWLQTNNIHVYSHGAPSVYLPITNENGQQQTASGYLSQSHVVLLSPDDLRSEAILNKILSEQKKDSDQDKEENKSDSAPQSAVKVLGVSTHPQTASSDDSVADVDRDNNSENDSADDNSSSNNPDANSDNSSSSNGSDDNSDGNSRNDTKDISDTNSNNVGASVFGTDSEDAKMLELLLRKQQDDLEQLASQSASVAMITLPRKEGKELLVSSSLLRLWEVSAEEIVGKKVSLEYIISAGLIRSISGRVVTDPIDYTIVGVFKNDEQPLVYAPLSDLESMGLTKYSNAKVLASDSNQLPKVREQIEAIGFMTRSIADTLSQVEKLFSVMRFLLASFGMIAFIVALFGMFNTLTVSLLERTREIGVMKTLGTTDRDIMKLMVVESTLIGLLGGFFGILLGISLGSFINWATLLLRDDRSASLFEFPFTFLVFVFILSVVVGLITGFYPARRAQSISALNALRYE